MTSDLEQNIGDVFAQQARLVPDASVDAVRRARYVPRTIGLGSRPAMAGLLAALAVAAVAVAALETGATKAHRAVRAVPVAYVGSAPRLAVTALPAGFRKGPDVPVAVLPGEPARPGLLPEKTFVAGSGSAQQTIVVEEGTNGSGPVAKLLEFGAKHPSAVSTVSEGGNTMTIVDLAALDAGSSAVIYFPVGASTWALVGGSPGVTSAQLLTVAEGITSAGL